jgi:hypothetical protein
MERDAPFRGFGIRGVSRSSEPPIPLRAEPTGDTMKAKLNVTTLRSVRESLKPVAEACEKIPASAIGDSWVSLPGGGNMVRVSDLRAVVRSYELLTSAIKGEA